MKLLLVGGGSGGPVSPLLAVAAQLRKTDPSIECLFVGGFVGPEKAMAEKEGIPFVAVTAGKLRRYASLKNTLTPFLVLIGFFQALVLIAKARPSVAFGSGSFIQVPVLWAAWVFRVPIVIHQQDIQPTLANKLCSIIATRITVTFEESVKDFSQGSGFLYSAKPEKVVHTGNPFREDLLLATKEQGRAFFGLHDALPVLYVTGGGTGASFINDLITNNLEFLTRTVQIIHATGKGKTSEVVYENYHAYAFISEVGLAFAAADFVLSRAGISTITELSNLRKIAIIVPMPNTHQEANAAFLARQHAAVVIPQDQLDSQMLVQVLKKILFDLHIQDGLKDNISAIMPKGSTSTVAEIILKAAHGK